MVMKVTKHSMQNKDTERRRDDENIHCSTVPNSQEIEIVYLHPWGMKKDFLNVYVIQWNIIQP